MNLQNEFRHALQDGMGKTRANLYKIVILPNREREMVAVAYSKARKEAILIIFSNQDFQGLSADEYLDEARLLNLEFGWFCAPAQPIGPQILWGGKTIGPAYAYVFHVFNEPTHGTMA